MGLLERSQVAACSILRFDLVFVPNFSKVAQTFVSLVGRHYATLRYGHLGMSLGFVCPRERTYALRFRPGVVMRGGIAMLAVDGAPCPVGLYALCALALFASTAASLLGSLLPHRLNKKTAPPLSLATRLSGSASTRRSAYVGWLRAGPVA